MDTDALVHVATVLSTYPCIPSCLWVNTLRPRQNGCYFPDNIFKCIFLNENIWILLKISLKFVPKVWINNISALVLIMVLPQQAPSHYLNLWCLVYWCIYEAKSMTTFPLVCIWKTSAEAACLNNLPSYTRFHHIHDYSKWQKLGRKHFWMHFHLNFIWHSIETLCFHGSD